MICTLQCADHFFIPVFVFSSSRSSSGVPRSSYAPSRFATSPKTTISSCCHSSRIVFCVHIGILYDPFGFFLVSLISFSHPSPYMPPSEDVYYSAQCNCSGDLVSSAVPYPERQETRTASDQDGIDYVSHVNASNISLSGNFNRINNLLSSG